MADVERGVERLRQKLETTAEREERSAAALAELLESPRWPGGLPIDLQLRPDASDATVSLAESYLG
jgi:hypothetical protein